MLGWFVGRVLRKNAEKDIGIAQDTVPFETQIIVARTLAQRMAFVENDGNRQGVQNALRAAETMLMQATRDRHLAVAKATGSFSDPAWLLASLSETWANARAGSLKGKISINAFRKIDMVIGGFLIATLGQDEVVRIATGKTAF